MATEGTDVSARREPELGGQTVVVIGGSAGIGLETARRARAEGADVVLTGRNPEHLQEAARDRGARRRPIDHILVTAGRPHYGPLLEMDYDAVRTAIGQRMVLALAVARNAAGKMRPGGTLLLIGGTDGFRVRPGSGIVPAAISSLPPFTASLALELAPVRVNLIDPGFVDTGLSASLLGDQLDARREELRATLPIGRVVGPGDVAALAIHLMVHTAITGATYDIDG